MVDDVVVWEMHSLWIGVMGMLYASAIDGISVCLALFYFELSENDWDD